MTAAITGSFSERLLLESRSAVVAGLSGVLAGFIVGGLGGRLAMRISMLIASGPVAGRLTEGGNRIGEFTADGTIGLLIFGGVGTGVIVAVYWYTLRPWLRRLGRGEIVATSVAAVALGTTVIIDPDNIDFRILEPASLQVGLFLILVALTGLLTPLIDRGLDRRLPRRQGALFVYLPLSAIGAVFTVPSFGSLVSETFCFCEQPPVAAGWLLLAAFGVTILLAARRLTGADRENRTLVRLGSLLAAAAIVTGLIYAVRGVVETL